LNGRIRQFTHSIILPFNHSHCTCGRALIFVGMERRFYLFTVLVMLSLVSGCLKLEVEPRDDASAERFFADETAYRAYLARLYAGLAITGQEGPAGDPDLQNIDEGFSSYLRQYWQLQELTTDEAIIGWTDEGLPDLHFHTWTSGNQFVRTMYSRIFYQIAQTNDFLRQTSPDKLQERAVSDAILADIPGYRAEARFLRTLSYLHGLDLFGRLPLYTENHPLGGAPLPQSSRTELFNFLETELHEILPYLPEAGAQEYGRVDRAAVWGVQARLFLNAETYTGRIRYDECIAACRKILNTGVYTLAPTYSDLFGTDNDTSPEIIFAIPFDGEQTKTWGGMTYLVHAPLGGRMNPLDYGVRGAWAGLRTTSALVDYFTEQPHTDIRASFYTNGQSLEIERINDFQDGYALPKYTNLSSTGEPGKDETFPDTDYPFLRLAEIYLTYAEATLRGGNGDAEAALSFLNALHLRSGATTSLTAADLTLEKLFRERTRELHWEAHRRTDLIRFGRFTNAGIWPWKGGSQVGETTEEFRNLFPIPEAELLANPSLEQNVGY